MKKYTFKGILLALGLVLATLSMQVGARDAGTDTDARADALWQTQLALTNAASTTARDALVNVNTVLDSNVVIFITPLMSKLAPQNPNRLD
jgi:nucleoside-specific outer membrane channel protein Tsx